MSGKVEEFQALLARMRADFLLELPERCDRFEQGVFALQAAPADEEAFQDLYRAVHSLKGLGGTHGLGVVTAICHQLENLLTESRERGDHGERFVSHALAFVDLLRRVAQEGSDPRADFAGVEVQLETLRREELESRKAGLIAESSTMMAEFCRQALSDLPVQLTVEPSGLAALELLLREPFDFLVVGRELNDLNGVALGVALRASRVRNQDIPVILVTSNPQGVPAHAGFTSVLARDQSLGERLAEQVSSLVLA